MNSSANQLPDEQFSEEITNLQTKVDNNPTDLSAKIGLASALEQGGYLSEALKVYEDIIENDEEGVFAASAQKAVEVIEHQLASTLIVDRTQELPPKISEKPSQQLSLENSTFKAKLENNNNHNLEKRVKNSDYLITKKGGLFQKFYNLPIRQKQFIALLASSLISIIAVVTAGILITKTSGRNQLENQAVSELEGMVDKYSSRLQEIESGLGGQANNQILIQAAKRYQEEGKISSNLKESVAKVLRNEQERRSIEYATLVGTDGKIIVNANQQNRTGDEFDLDNLISEVIENPREVKTNTIIPWEEIEKESPILPSAFENEDALVKLTLTPVKDETGNLIGVLVGGEIVNNKTEIIEESIKTLRGGYGAIYRLENQSQGENPAEFSLVTSVLIDEEEESQPNVEIQDLTLLRQAAQGVGGDLTQRINIQGKWYTVAVKSEADSSGKPLVFLVRGTPETNLNALLKNSLVLQIGVAIVSLIIAIIVAYFLGKALTKPIEKLRESAQKIANWERNARAEVLSEDEVGELAQAFNKMAEKIESYTQAIEQQSKLREEEATYQREEKEKLQKSVINLLLQIEEASKGDLTVQAEVDSGEVGSISDAFNTTIVSLEKLVKEVIMVANQVNDSALKNGASVAKLSENAIEQDQAINMAGKSVEEIAKSISNVSKSAQTAAAIARQSRLAAEEGQAKMDRTVDSIYKIRDSVADTSKKAKRLADSSQEISKIVSIISGIAEKTNLLAFNASIEAARAKEHGQGFRVVANEVRRLAEQVNLSAQEIEQLIIGIQEETAAMMGMMEESTIQVVMGTKLVRNTKSTLQKVAQISEEIDNIVQSISSSTVSQRSKSQKVTETMQAVGIVAQQTSEESKLVSSSLQELVKVANDLQDSASHFKVGRNYEEDDTQVNIIDVDGLVVD